MTTVYQHMCNPPRRTYLQFTSMALPTNGDYQSACGYRGCNKHSALRRSPIRLSRGKQCVCVRRMYIAPSPRCMPT
ncbi:hypothetical protein AHF37_03901 [Paragonimus kellicotti]|nr:hypothetical protein AHF37_03901 [Paragonimus kellicotti]